MTRSVVAISLGAVLLVSAFAASVSVAQAESVVWTSPQQPRIQYTFGRRGTWLDYFIATIQYQARMVNPDTGVVIPSGTAVGIGSKVRFEHIPHTRPDIYWYGTGGRYDTPYGDWIASAGNPDPKNACTSQNFFQHHDDDGMFGLLSIHPPTKTISTNISGSSFSCGAPAADGSVTCTANSMGGMNATANFASTYGKMYLAANEWNGTNPVNCQYPNGAGLAVLSSTGGPYQLTVPAKSVSFAITTTYATGQPPSAPTVTAISSGGGGTPSSTQCVVGSSYGLSIRSTDPEGQQIRYYIDWNGDGFVDQIAPSTGYVPSGTSIAVSRTYSVGGSHSIRVQATDQSGFSSVWTTYSFTCADEPGVENQEEGTGGGGGTGGTGGGVIANLNLRAVPSLVRSGETTRLFWSAGDVAHCDVTGTNGDGGAGWDTLASPVSGKVSGAITEQTTYTLSCYTFSDALITDTATVNILPQWSEQ